MHVLALKPSCTIISGAFMRAPGSLPRPYFYIGAVQMVDHEPEPRLLRLSRDCSLRDQCDAANTCHWPTD